MKKGGGTISPYVLCRGDMIGVEIGGGLGVTGDDTWMIGDSKGMGLVVHTTLFGGLASCTTGLGEEREGGGEGIPTGIVAVFSVFTMLSLVGVDGFDPPFDKLVFLVTIGSNDSSVVSFLDLSMLEGLPGLILVGVFTVFVP